MRPSIVPCVSPCLLWLVLVAVSPYGHPQSIDYNCATSLPIDPSLIVEDEERGMSIPCKAFEDARYQALVDLEGLRQTFDQEGIEGLRRRVIRLEQALSSAEEQLDDSETDLAIAAALETAASLSLVGCANTAGLGCALAGIGFVGSKIALIRAGGSIEDRRSTIRAFQAELREARNTLSDEADLESAFQRAAASFNKMCATVKSQCMVE